MWLGSQWRGPSSSSSELPSTAAGLAPTPGGLAPPRTWCSTTTWGLGRALLPQAQRLACRGGPLHLPPDPGSFHRLSSASASGSLALLLHEPEPHLDLGLPLQPALAGLVPTPCTPLKTIGITLWIVSSERLHWEPCGHCPYLHRAGYGFEFSSPRFTGQYSSLRLGPYFVTGSL